MLYPRAMEPRIMGFCAGFEPLGQGPWIHPVRHRRLRYHLPADAAGGSEWHQPWRQFRFSFTKPTKPVSLWIQRRVSGFCVGSLVDGPYRWMAPCGFAAHFLQPDVDPTACAADVGNLWPEPNGDYLYDRRRGRIHSEYVGGRIRAFSG